jgi:hypothetical protein
MEDVALRKIDMRYMKRAEKVPTSDVGEHLDSIAISLHRALDSWRHSDGSIEDVTLCVDALVALWSVVESRVSV